MIFGICVEMVELSHIFHFACLPRWPLQHHLHLLRVWLELMALTMTVEAAPPWQRQHQLLQQQLHIKQR